MFENAGCNHVKTVGQPDFELLLEDVKTPSDDASNVGKRFFTQI
jgi:hypothetical protein